MSKRISGQINKTKKHGHSRTSCTGAAVQAAKVGAIYLSRILIVHIFANRPAPIAGRLETHKIAFNFVLHIRTAKRAKP